MGSTGLLYLNYVGISYSFYRQRGIASERMWDVFGENTGRYRGEKGPKTVWKAQRAMRIADKAMTSVREKTEVPRSVHVRSTRVPLSLRVLEGWRGGLQ